VQFKDIVDPSRKDRVSEFRTLCAAVGCRTVTLVHPGGKLELHTGGDKIQFHIAGTAVTVLFDDP
jgi:hypothetical protein